MAKFLVDVLVRKLPFANCSVLESGSLQSDDIHCVAANEAFWVLLGEEPIM